MRQQEIVREKGREMFRGGIFQNRNFRERYERAIHHLVEAWSKSHRLRGRQIWMPDIEISDITWRGI